MRATGNRRTQVIFDVLILYADGVCAAYLPVNGTGREGYIYMRMYLGVCRVKKKMYLCSDEWN